MFLVKMFLFYIFSPDLLSVVKRQWFESEIYPKNFRRNLQSAIQPKKPKPKNPLQLSLTIEEPFQETMTKHFLSTWWRHSTEIL